MDCGSPNQFILKRSERVSSGTECNGERGYAGNMSDAWKMKSSSMPNKGLKVTRSNKHKAKCDFFFWRCHNDGSKTKLSPLWSNFSLNVTLLCGSMSICLIYFYIKTWGSKYIHKGKLKTLESCIEI